MELKTLCLRANGSALVQDHAALEAGINRFIGWKHTEIDPGVWAKVATGEAVHVPNKAPHASEYFMALRAGDLLPGDEATAAWAGIAFESKPAKAEPAKGNK